MSIVDMIKTMANNSAQLQNPVNVLFGTITSVDPIEIEIHEKLKLTKDFIVMTERVTKYEIDLKHNHDATPSEVTTKDALVKKIVIREGLKKGDGVVMLRAQGGQQYVVIDKVVD